MLQRCNNPRAAKYGNHGGRGIVVCERWRSFVNFLADMGERPIGRTLDRRDNDGNYEPGNCRWATTQEQNQNNRHCKLTPDLVREILGRFEHGESQASIRRRLGLEYSSTISGIVRGATWSNIHMEGCACPA